MKNKKMLAILMTSALTCSLLMGCGSSEEPAQEAAVEETTLEEAEEEVDEVVEEEAEEVEEAVEDAEDFDGTFASLEEYYSQEDVFNETMAAIEEVYQNYTDTYSDMGFSVVDNTFTYQYYYAEEMEDPEAVAASIIDSLSATSDEDKEMIGRGVSGESGITSGFSVVYEYYQPDETFIVDYVFEY